MKMERSKSVYEYYVCPECFRRIDECKCDYYPPWMLINIDIGIQEHIQTLNDKGYKTISCCESHFDGNHRMYISFNRDFELGKLPDGFKYEPKKHSVYFDISHKLTEPKFYAVKTGKITELLEWCQNLPDLKGGN